MSDCVINPLTGRAIKKTGATYKQLEKKKEKTGVLESKVQAKNVKKEYDEKKKASTTLQSAIKRKIAKKPEPPEPPKKFGFEDLDEGVKDMISAYVKKNKKEEVDKIGRKNLIKRLKSIFNIFRFYLIYYDYLSFKSDKIDKMILKYSKLTDDELYNLLYREGINKLIVDTINELEYSNLLYKITTAKERTNENRGNEITGKIKPSELKSLPDDKDDNSEFKKYYKMKNVYLRLYTQRNWKSDNYITDYYVLVNPISAGENVGKLLKLNVPDTKNKFLDSWEVRKSYPYREGKKEVETIESHLRYQGFLNNSGFIVKDGILSLKNPVSIRSYNKIISKSIESYLYYSKRWINRVVIDISPDQKQREKLLKKGNEAYDYFKKYDKEIMERFNHYLIYEQ